MRSRWFLYGLCGFLAVWFGVVLPAHERGQIGLPGSTCSSTNSSCCPTEKDDDPVERCAVCYLIATLDLAPPPLLDAPPLQRLGRINPAAPTRRISTDVATSFHERAPPA